MSFLRYTFFFIFSCISTTTLLTQINLNEVALMYLDNGASFNLTYDVDAMALNETSSTTRTPSSGKTIISHGAYFGDEYGEAGVYYDGIGFAVDLRFKLDSFITPIITIPNYTSLSNVSHIVSGNFQGGEEDELFVIYSDGSNRAILYDISAVVDAMNNATITTTSSATMVDFAYVGNDAYALDIDNDGFDEIAIATWTNNKLFVEVLEVNPAGLIESKYVKEVFGMAVGQCLFAGENGNGSQFNFNYEYASIAIAGGNFSDDFPGEELAIGANFTQTSGSDDDSEANEGLYLFPLRETLDGNGMPTIVIPNWCTEVDPRIDVSVSEQDYDPGLDMDAGDIIGLGEEEVVLGYGDRLRVYYLNAGSALSGGYIPMTIGTRAYQGSIGGAQPSSDNFTGPGQYADQFISVGNVDPVDASITSNIKEDILYGSNSYSVVTNDGQQTTQSFSIEVIGLDNTGSLVSKGSLSELSLSEVDNEIAPRRFSIELIDFDGGGLALNYQTRNSVYDISLGLPPLVPCGDNTSGFVTAGDDQLTTVANVISNASFENFHYVPQEDSTQLALYVQFDQDLDTLSKTIKVKHFRTKIGGSEKELFTIHSYPVAAGENSLSTNYIFNPRSGSKDDALVITVETENGNNFTSVITPLIVTGVDYTVPVLGTTITPQIPQLILHDPPGDQSFSSFTAGRTICRSLSQNITTGSGSETELNVKIGIAGEAGFIVTTAFEFSTTFSAGLRFESSRTTGESIEQCITTTNSFQTSNLPDAGNIGTNGDIFIGFGERLVYGIEKDYSLNTTLCGIDSTQTFAYASDPNGVVKFVFTSADIEADIIMQQAIVDNVTIGALDKARAQSQIDVWTKVLNRNTNNIANAVLIQGEPSITVTGGGQVQTSSTEVSTTEVASFSYDIFTEASAGNSTVVEVGGSGVSGGIKFSFSNKKEGGTEVTTDDTKMIEYTLQDDDILDLFNVNIFRDPEYGTPVFKLGLGSKTSCPYEGGIRRDIPRITADAQCSFQTNSKALYVDNIDPNVSAVFDLNICNNSAEERTYILELTNNDNGANVSVANTPLNNVNNIISYTVAAGGCSAPLLTIGRNPQLPMVGEDMYEPKHDVYNDLTFLLYPACGGAAVKSEANESQISVTFGRDGEYPFGDRDCDGTLNQSEDCIDILTLSSASGILSGTYQAKNEIIIQPMVQFAAGNNVNLNAPVVTFEDENTVPMTSGITVSSTGCQN